MRGFEYKKIDNNLVIKISKNIYPLVCIKKASANFMEIAYIAIEEENDKYVISLNKLKEDLEDNTVIGEFYNELLRECIRYDVSKETKNIRELIVGRSLYSTCIEEDETADESNNLQIEKVIENTNYNIDDIAVSWFDDK